MACVFYRMSGFKCCRSCFCEERNRMKTFLLGYFRFFVTWVVWHIYKHKIITAKNSLHLLPKYMRKWKVKVQIIQGPFLDRLTYNLVFMIILLCHSINNKNLFARYFPIHNLDNIDTYTIISLYHYYGDIIDSISLSYNGRNLFLLMIYLICVIYS